MRNILKEIKPFVLVILVIVGLLYLQAMTDLALPDYMSRIVNVGIQQNGIENAVPDLLSIDSFNKLSIFMTTADQEIVASSYRLISQGTEEYEGLLRKYPSLTETELYVLQDLTVEEMDALNAIFGKAILIVSGREKGMLEESLPQALSSDVDPLAIIPESFLTQAATTFIKEEYQSLGMEIQKVQSNYILTVGGIMLAIALVGMTASISVGFLSARVSAALGRSLRSKIFKKVTTFSTAEINNFSTASLITRTTNDVQQVQMFIIMLLRSVVYAPILGVGGVLRALRTNTSMAWIIAVGVLAISTLVVTLFAIATPKFKKLQQLVDRVNRVMREALSGMLVIRAFNNQNYEEEKFEQANQDLTRTHLFVSRLMALMMPTMMLLMNGITLLIIWVGAHEVDQGVIQVGDMMAFMQYTMQIIMSFLMISMISLILPRASVSIRRINEVLVEEVTIKEPKVAKQFPNTIEGKIEFRNVSFKYPGAEEYVLQNVSFVAEPGKTTAFIGSTGSGKSTLVNLIPRFYDATEGDILIDGINIKDLRLKELRKRIGYVPQQGVLFMGTIESNLRYGKNHDASEQAIEKAVRVAQAKDFIAEKADQLQTEIAQGGTNVSGGQRQRLSIARALAKEPEILIFDDSFSALDFKTDAALRKAISKEIKNRTILVVAQRIATIVNADQIVVLDQGKVVGIGTHRELFADCPVYREIATSQLSEEELAI